MMRTSKTNIVAFNNIRWFLHNGHIIFYINKWLFYTKCFCEFLAIFFTIVLNNDICAINPAGRDNAILIIDVQTNIYAINNN